MLVTEFDQHVQKTDQFAHYSEKERKEIAIYGLASEIGSVSSAIKKRLLQEDGDQAWDASNPEIEEELGDVMWYCFALARLENSKRPLNVLIHDIQNLSRELASDSPRSELIRHVIGAENRESFLEAAKSFRRSTRDMTFSQYQSVAYLTARTQGKTLVEVCVAVLYQLSAELFRSLLPEIELHLNKFLPDRAINDILGEIAWHIAALASIYCLDLNSVAQKNVEKVAYRQDRDKSDVIKHDAGFPEGQQFPRKFEVTFVTPAKGKAQMYWGGRKLGNELSDNAYDDDGYRFHDVMHLANVAHLGWSPVLRDLMGLKRKAVKDVDEIEDGARAKIVEEAVVKTIHAEGKQLAGPENGEGPVRLFRDRADISFKFIKRIQGLTLGLEVQKNKFWEWEDAILEGYDAYHRLRIDGQGTLAIDLEARSLKFYPHVFIPLAGQVVGFGTASVLASSEGRIGEDIAAASEGLRLEAKRRAVLASLGFSSPSSEELESITVVERADDEVSVRTFGKVRQAMWDRKAIVFRVSALLISQHWVCNAVALADS